jgi:branched-chain amino acid transport system permease protein
MNLAYGETIIAAAFGAYVIHNTLWRQPDPRAGRCSSPARLRVQLDRLRPDDAPAGAPGEKPASLEIDSILATFGLLFVLQGVMLVLFGSNYTSYSYLNVGVNVLGTNIAANRLLAFLLAIVLGGGLYLLLTRTLWGTALRAVAVSPGSAPLVGIDVDRAARFGFAIGGALAAAGGVAISMYQTFTATAGVVFTMKALIVVIMGGVGNVLARSSPGSCSASWKPSSPPMSIPA